MTVVRRLLVALAIGAALCAPARAASPSVVSVDYARVYKESLAGKDAQNKLKRIEADINKELEPTQKQVDADHKALDPRMEGKSRAQIEAEMKKDKAYADKVEKAATREDRYLALVEIRRQELSATREKAIKDLIDASIPVVREAMEKRKASIAIQVGQALAVAPDADVTEEVIARLDKKVTTLSVTKISLTKSSAK